MALVGREDDLNYLKDKAVNGRNRDVRERAKHYIETIAKEDKNPTVSHLRSKLIDAERRDDAREADKIREAIRRETA